MTLDFYNRFIVRPCCDWRKDGTKGFYRVMSRRIVAHRKDHGTAVVASTPDVPDNVCDEIARLVKRLLDRGRVEDPNQVQWAARGFSSSGPWGP